MKKKHPFIILAALTFLAALGLTLYPLISTAYNERHRSEIHTHYEEQIMDTDRSQLLSEKKKALAYNKRLTDYNPDALQEAEREYEDCLNLVNDGIMGYVKIPKIDVLFPIYHGTNADTLEWRFITKKKNATIVVLDMPLLDTRKNKDLTGTLIADVVLQLLSYVAQTEREFIRQRQKEGIQAAKNRGVKFGRTPIPKPDNYEEIHVMWADGRISGREAARRLGISQFTFRNWTKKVDFLPIEY